ncbi:S8 family serine peptidase, partial [candidate division WOR-3 bacterium]|nr:S8 family serine peptidase [candidate division WOR-3 bacterium]MBD3364623.1 S8 family serine peptidase [candidate division WOR-3 bacterium]
TSDLSRLEKFAEPLGIEVKPLIYYPNPSEETMELYGDQYILKFSTEDQTTINLAVNKLERLHGVKSVTPDVILDVQPISYYDEPYEYEDESHSRVMSPNPYTPNDPRYPDQWDKPLVETDIAWNTTTGEGAGVAVLDQGVDTTHEDLVDNLYMGWDFNEDDADYYDIGGHGTQCCGVACAKIDNGIGIAGVAGDGNLMACKIWGDNDLYTSMITNAINYAVDNDVKAISMSWGGYEYNSFLNNIMNDAWDRGAFLCAGAANSNIDDPFYPAAYDKVMAVGGIQSDGGRWTGSNYGDWVQIFAPGGLSTKRGGGYGGVQATSFTTPQIAGLAALVWSAYPHATNQQVWDNIINGADTIDSDVGPILRMNSKNAVEEEIIAVEEELYEPELKLTATIQQGVIKLSAPATAIYSLCIFDASGRLVHAEDGQSNSSGEVTCNPDIDAGVFFWQFQTAEGTKTGKVVYVK